MKDFRIKIQFVYLEIWNQKDHFVVDDVARATLSAFLHYRLEMMMHSNYDFAHFLTYVADFNFAFLILHIPVPYQAFVSDILYVKKVCELPFAV